MQVVLHSIGTTITQAEVVLFAAALVAMALNAELDAGVRLQKTSRIRERRFLILANIGLVVVEINVANVLGECIFDSFTETVLLALEAEEAEL